MQPPYAPLDKPLFRLSDIGRAIHTRLCDKKLRNWNPPVHPRAKQHPQTGPDNIDTVVAQDASTASSISTMTATSSTSADASTPVLSHEQEYIKKVVEDGNSIFYTGSAGQLCIFPCVV
jgi:hypothetical protein